VEKNVEETGRKIENGAKKADNGMLEELRAREEIKNQTTASKRTRKE
jgi:hypothetical protein